MSEKSPEDTQWALWEVFLQTNSGDPYEHAGSVHAVDGETALQNARDTFCRHGSVINGIWVVEARRIVATTPEDNPSFFEPTAKNIYRHPQFYKVPRGVRTEAERRRKPGAEEK